MMRTPQRTSHLGSTLGRVGQTKHSKMSVTRKAVYVVLLLAIAAMLLRTLNFRSAAPSSSHSAPYAETDATRYASTVFDTSTEPNEPAVSSSALAPVFSSARPDSPYSPPNESPMTSHTKNAPTPAPSALTFWAATERAEKAHAAAIEAEKQEVAAVLALSPCKDATAIDGPEGRRPKKLTWVFERQQRSHNYHEPFTSNRGDFATPLGDLCRARESASAIACPAGCRHVMSEPYCAAGDSNNISGSGTARGIMDSVRSHVAPCRLTAAVLTRARADAYAALVAARSEAKRAARMAERAPLREAPARRRKDIANAEAEKKAAIQRREEAANAEAEEAQEIERREAEANAEAEAEAAAFAFAKAAVLAAAATSPPPQATHTTASSDLTTHDAARNTTSGAAVLAAVRKYQPQTSTAASPKEAASLTLKRGVALATHLAALDKAAADAEPSSHYNDSSSSSGMSASDLEAWRDAYFFACFDNGESYGASWFASTASVFRRVVSTGPREHMETAGGLGQPPGNTPLKTVNLLDFSVEHISWLDRRLGLRYMQGHLKASLTTEFLAFLKNREVKARQDALAMQGARLQRQQEEAAAASRAEALRHQRQRRRRRRLRAKDENPVPDGQPGGTQRSAVPTANETAPWQGEDGFLEDSSRGGGGGVIRVRKPVKVIAVFPYFATTDHCRETGPAASNKGKSLGSAAPGARCDSGSSDPLLRRYFLNLTFWTVHKVVTPSIALSTCSDADERFARNESGLPFVAVFRSDCRVWHPEFQKVVFKPGLLGVLTLMRLQERLRSDSSFQAYTHVFYNEADQVVHSRLSVSDLARATLPRSRAAVSPAVKSGLSKPDRSHWPHPYIVPHRLQPISDPQDLPSLLHPNAVAGRGLSRWVPEDVARVQGALKFLFPPSTPPLPSATSSASLNGASALGNGGISGNSEPGSCCVDRGECRTRKHWLPWKVPPSTAGGLAVMKIGDSLTMVAGEGDFGNLVFRNCTTLSLTRSGPCPL